MGNDQSTPSGLNSSSEWRPGQKPRPGQRVGHFRLVELIGEGAMGYVFKAEDLTLGRMDAVKFLNPAKLQGGAEEVQSAKERFVREAKMMARVNHPNIVQIYEAVLDRDFPYFAMEYVPGLTLEKRATEQPALSYAEVCAIAVQVARALRFAWERFQIVHRDLKPANIMIPELDSVKVVDMGIAKTFRESRTSKQFSTRTGIMVGTLGYMAPEQHLGVKDLDQRADIFALGVMLCELFTFRSPFAGRSVLDLVASKNRGLQFPVGRYAKGLPDEVAKLVTAMLHPERDCRLDAYDVVIDVLTEAAAKLRATPTAKRPGPPAGGKPHQTTVTMPMDETPTAGDDPGDTPITTHDEADEVATTTRIPAAAESGRPEPAWAPSPDPVPGLVGGPARAGGGTKPVLAPIRPFKDVGDQETKVAVRPAAASAAPPPPVPAPAPAPAPALDPMQSTVVSRAGLGLEPTKPTQSGRAPRGSSARVWASLDVMLAEVKPGYEVLGYRLVQMVGRGECGAVFRAQSVSDGPPAAVKFLVSEGGKGFRQRFEQVAAHLSRLRQRSICAVLASKAPPPCCVVVSDLLLVPGNRPFNLHEYRRSFGQPGGQLGEREVQKISLLLLEALACAHEHEVLHGNLKPENVLFQCMSVEDDYWRLHLQLTDLGVAMLFDPARRLQRLQALATQPATEPTAAAARATLAYASPEQAAGAPPTIASDLYGAGLLIFYALTGQLATPTEHRPSVVRPGIDPGWDAILGKVLRPDASRRFKDATEMASYLEALELP